MDLKKSILTFVSSLFIFGFGNCSSDSDMDYTLKVVSSDPSLGTVYIDSPGTTSKKVSAGESVKIYAVPSSSEASFVNWTYVENGSLKTIGTAEYTVSDIAQDYIFTANFSDGGIVVFEDDFEQESRIPDPTKWELCKKQTSNWNRYNSESYDQAYVEDGKLVLVAEKVNGVYKTGAIRMLNDLGFEHCYVEVCAKFTKMAQGGWPAIWLMPAQPLYGGWPNSGEIDVMEHLNKDNSYYIALHTNYIDNLGNKNNPPSSDQLYVNTSEFNTYGMDWNDEEINFYLNGVKKLTYPNLHLSDESSKLQWPFNTTFYLILNHALGGAGTWPGPINDNDLPAFFEIEYVKVTKL